MLFSAVLMIIPNSKVCLKGAWSIEETYYLGTASFLKNLMYCGVYVKKLHLIFFDGVAQLTLI